MPTGTAARSSPWIQTKEAQMPVYSATRDDEIDRCFPVMSQLRPHLERAHFVEQIRRQQQRGYHLAYVEEDRKIYTAAGFRIEENLAHGLHLYVDDLVTDSETRSRGYGTLMLNWLAERARQSGCAILDLDSGVQRSRAHRFYLDQDMKIFSYHFAKALH